MPFRLFWLLKWEDRFAKAFSNKFFMDILSPKERSIRMKGIRSQATKPERAHLE
jgi:hypothetical protein